MHPTIKNFLATTATICYLTLSEGTQVPSESYELPIISPLDHSWEMAILNPYYSISEADANNILGRIEILHNFASKLLKNSEDLDPSFAKLINDNFSKLV